MIDLCSKTYVVANDDECKFSSKGINKKHVSDPWETYDLDLTNQKAGFGLNRGVGAWDNTMFTYTPERSVFFLFLLPREDPG
jgi:hypothetical protein